ncbi:DUF4342 domain-containing protein [Thermoclostridium stercorarium]|nr:DUF4342 domain-containing protein [Thermoclostridium stercorarium]AGI39453.1 hypothetical protein Clst_1393 [Thermoclostridium stercorarium subsp. stercorarium DSM 8532]UZQ84432.1 DUF4342 domain-containing protein [Thermoclostridium stercorarium]
MITLEQVDQMRKRTNCSYEEAKFFLEKHNGDLLEAIVDFEKNKNGTKTQSFISGKNAGDFWQSVSKLIKQGFVTRVIIEDNERNVIINVPVNIMLLFVIFASYIVIPILLILLLLGYKLSIRNTGREETGVSSAVRDITAVMESNDLPQNQQGSQLNDENIKDNYSEIIIE